MEDQSHTAYTPKGLLVNNTSKASFEHYREQEFLLLNKCGNPYTTYLHPYKMEYHNNTWQLIHEVTIAQPNTKPHKTLESFKAMF